MNREILETLKHARPLAHLKSNCLIFNALKLACISFQRAYARALHKIFCNFRCILLLVKHPIHRSEKISDSFLTKMNSWIFVSRWLWNVGWLYIFFIMILYSVKNLRISKFTKPKIDYQSTSKVCQVYLPDKIW